MLPVNFLRQLISMYGDSMQSMVPSYLEASMDSFRRNQEQFRSAVEGAFATGPFAEIAKRNMAMFEAAATAFKPPVGGVPTPAPTPPSSTPATDDAKDDTLAALKAEMAALQAKVEKLGG
jgi:polyhydroxyalkanoate synthesis regulator protein